MCRGGESNTRHVALPSVSLDYLITLITGAGRLCGIIVGTHPLVSTPSGKPLPYSKSLSSLARDCFGKKPKFSPSSPSFHLQITSKRPENVRRLLYH